MHRRTAGVRGRRGAGSRCQRKAAGRKWYQLGGGPDTELGAHLLDRAMLLAGVCRPPASTARHHPHLVVAGTEEDVVKLAHLLWVGDGDTDRSVGTRMNGRGERQSQQMVVVTGGRLAGG